MPVARRVAAADAFWRDESAEDIQAQHIEAMVLLARRLNFRAKTVQGLPVEKRAHHLARMSEISDAIATRALIAYHFQTQRPLMAAFLDALGIAHDNGLITGENVGAPDTDRLIAAIDSVRASFPADDVTCYLRTLTALDSDTWGAIEGLLARTV
jgi:hypothetical protein